MLRDSVTVDENLIFRGRWEAGRTSDGLPLLSGRKGWFDLEHLNSWQLICLLKIFHKIRNFPPSVSGLSPSPSSSLTATPCLHQPQA